MNYLMIAEPLSSRLLPACLDAASELWEGSFCHCELIVGAEQLVSVIAVHLHVHTKHHTNIFSSVCPQLLLGYMHTACGQAATIQAYPATLPVRFSTAHQS